MDGGLARRGPAPVIPHLRTSSSAPIPSETAGPYPGDGTNSSGEVRFTTIFPGCYSGRWPHIHFEAYPSLAAATSGNNNVKTSQLALPAAACNQAYGVASGFATTLKVGVAG